MNNSGNKFPRTWEINKSDSGEIPLHLPAGKVKNSRLDKTGIFDHEFDDPDQRKRVLFLAVQKGIRSSVNMMSWKQRFDYMKQYFGWYYEDIAKITGNNTDSIQTVLSQQDIPRWAKLAVYVFEKLRKGK